MPDQAAGLRSLFARRRPSLLIVAGSDPCKAAIAVHFAREAAAGGRATLLIDGTAGQVASACDQACRYELSHVLAGDKPLSDVLRSLTPHLMLLPAARALSRFGSFTADEEARLNDAFSNGITAALTNAGVSEAQVDLIVVNAEEAHAARAVEAFGRDARVVIVASDYAASLRGAYVEMKALSHEGLENFEIVVPRFEEAAGAGVAFANLAATAQRFLEIELVDGGTVLLKASGSTPATRSAPIASNTTSAVAADDLADELAEPSSDSSFATSTSQDEVPHAAVA